MEYKKIINKEENYISLENQDHIILLDFKNQIVNKSERKLEGKSVDFTIEEIILINQIMLDVVEGVYGR